MSRAVFSGSQMRGLPAFRHATHRVAVKLRGRIALALMVLSGAAGGCDSSAAPSTSVTAN